MQAIGKRMLLLFICIIAMLSVFSTVAHASWTGSFGGAGGSGTVGNGFWSQQMQGIRITIMTPDGQPAFYFGDRDPYVNYLDILYTDKNTTGITAMFGSSKGIEAVSPGHNTYDKLGAGDKGNLVYVNGQPNDGVMGNGNYTARAGTEACIVSFEWYNQWLGENRWTYVPPVQGTEGGISSSFNSIASTLPIEDMGEVWKRNGEQIGKWLYNTDTEAKKPADTAAIHLMFNIYNLASPDDSPLWHLTDAGEALFSPEMVSAYEEGLSRMDQGLHVYRTTELMELGNMAIVVEPIIWAEIRNYGGQRSGMMLYLTPTNVADGIR